VNRPDLDKDDALNFKGEVMDEYRQRRELGHSVAARRRRG
jgi:hypothetical protein